MEEKKFPYYEKMGDHFLLYDPVGILYDSHQTIGLIIHVAFDGSCKLMKYGEAVVVFKRYKTILKEETFSPGESVLFIYNEEWDTEVINNIIKSDDYLTRYHEQLTRENPRWVEMMTNMPSSSVH